MLASIFLPLLLQVGPNPALTLPPAVPDELVEQRRLTRERQSAPLAIVEFDPVQTCAARAEADPASALANAQALISRSNGVDRAIAGHCAALALSAQEQWSAAAQAFAEARAALPAGQADYAARLALAQGAAHLASGDGAAALAAADQAHTNLAHTNLAGPGGNGPLAGAIQTDRARALVALGRLDEAAAALVTARDADPDNDEVWLLSATLSRRMGDLAAAQAQIERAAILRPAGPEIGLEAGVIAALDGRDEAALRSWRSVLESAPGTPAALTAADYIAQLRGQ